MTRKIIQDVVHDDSGSAKSNMLEKKDTSPSFLTRSKRPSRTPLGSIAGKRRPDKKWMVIIGIIVVVIAGFWVSSSAFSSATIVVTPRQESAAVDIALNAYRDNANSERLGFSVVQARDEAQAQVVPSGTKTVERKATGQIIITNNFDSKDLRLIKDTRFEAPNGNIYRIQNAIVVPGKTTGSEGDLPGTIEATVVADQPGEAYNIGIVDFTIPGLKGDERYDKVRARSKTPMTGGFNGEVYVISDDERDRVSDELQEVLEQNLFALLESAVPQGHILLTDATDMIFDPLDDAVASTEGSNGDEVSLVQSGTVFGVVISEAELARFIANQYIDDYDGSSITLSNPEDLIIDVTDVESIDVIEDQIVPISITGNANLLWLYDTDALKNDLAGKSRSSYNDIFAGYETIERAEVSVSPPWKRSFPKKIEDIQVETAVINE